MTPIAKRLLGAGTAAAEMDPTSFLDDLAGFGRNTHWAFDPKGAVGEKSHLDDWCGWFSSF